MDAAPGAHARNDRYPSAQREQANRRPPPPARHTSAGDLDQARQLTDQAAAQTPPVPSYGSSTGIRSLPGG